MKIKTLKILIIIYTIFIQTQTQRHYMVIAKHLNIAPLSTIFFIILSLELIFDTKLYIPGIISSENIFMNNALMFSYNKGIKISSNFFFNYIRR